MVNHIAIIPDGNRRWSNTKGLSTINGHDRAFLEIAPTILEALWKERIHTTTLWLFSTENWNRSNIEVQNLMIIYYKFLKKIHEMAESYQLRIIHLGRKDRIPSDLLSKVMEIEQSTKYNKGLFFNFALDYGGLDEVNRATKAMMSAIKNQNSYFDLQEHLDTAGQPFPDPDLIIRTSGEQRMSGFMPIQSAYSEWFFIKKYFPDLCVSDVFETIHSFTQKNRRYGK